MENIIQTENLTKFFGDVHAVENISLTVRRGEIYGFLGLNGAGKTTMIRILLGMIHPTSGSASIFGKKITSTSCELWKDVGYLVETPHSYPDLTVWENLEIIRRLRGVADKNVVNDVMEKLKLTSYSNRKTKNLSLGNAQRLGLAKALLHNPKILILDEPSNGLDPAGIVEIREMFRNLSSNFGTTIFISSHILGEISKFATRIGIIHEGRLIQEVNIEQLEHLLSKRLVINTIDNKASIARLLKENYLVKQSKEGYLEVTGKDAIDHPERIATFLVNANLPPSLLKVEEENLESYFLRIIGGK